MPDRLSELDAIIIGAGAAGLMCAIAAGKNSRRIMVVDHGKKIGEKIRISGGGRCNFTNIHADAKNYISANPRFAISALSRFTPADITALIEKHSIAYHEKEAGQLFCDGSASQVVDMLLGECRDVGAEIRHPLAVTSIAKTENGFVVKTDNGEFAAAKLVIATGGLSIPKIGASSFAHDIARQFGINVIATAPALVPLVFSGELLQWMNGLSGVSLQATVTCNRASFTGALLFTHRGLSGPAILQASSYYNPGDEIIIDLMPGMDALAELKSARENSPARSPGAVLATWLPKRLARAIGDEYGAGKNIGEIPNRELAIIAKRLNHWHITPGGSEGYRTAEVTRGGIDTAELSSKTMECKKVPGLYFIGEAIDVTGQLGGFNFQWAWASGFAAGSSI